MSKATVILIAFFAFFVSSALSDPTPIINTQNGPVQGVTSGNISSFLGIPYAAPPVGDLRWKAPAPHASWSQPLNASAYGPTCPQDAFINIPLTYSEDCLYLNVFAPTSALSKGASPLPVMFWIHGGGFTLGGAAQFPADTLVAERLNVIIVTINYRLTIFGFMSLPALIDENPELNYGLQDQQFALQWVQQNIQNFGGDPSRVTIWGESAGGGSVALHLIMKKSFPYYSFAISESPGFWLYPTQEYASTLGVQFANTTPCADISDPASQLSCLRSQNWTDLMMDVSKSFRGSLSYIPSIDGQQLFEQPGLTFSKGQFNQNLKGMIAGTNFAEGNLITFLDMAILMNSTSFYMSIEQFNFLIDFWLGPQLATLALNWYSDYIDQYGLWYGFSAIIGDFTFNCGTNIMADAMVSANIPVWRYLFNQTIPQSAFPMALEVTHLYELPLVFGNPNLLSFNEVWDANTTQLSNTMGEFWTNFATTGTPNAGDVPFQWISYEGTETPTTLLLMTPGLGVNTIKNWREEYCVNWYPWLEQ